MNQFELAKRLDGLNTIEDIERKMGIGRQTAVNYVHRLRARGFVETMRGARGKRVYRIEAGGLRKVGNPGLVETINSFSDIKLIPPFPERYVGKSLSNEEAFLAAVRSEDFRLVMAAISVFKHKINWPWLAKKAREQRAGRKVGALYFASRRLFRVRAVKSVHLNMLRQSKDPKGKPLDKGFGDIEKEWGVAIPFGIMDYRGVRNGKH